MNSVTYKSIQSTKFDPVFEKLNLGNSEELLLENGFTILDTIKKGKYSHAVYSNGTYLVKLFDVDHYDTAKYFPNFRDYTYLEELQNIGIYGITEIYGYKHNEFMVVEFAGYCNLRPELTPKLTLSECYKLLIYLHSLFLDIYLKTGAYPDDLASKNIVWDGSDFKFVDYSCIAAFSATYFAKDYLFYRLRSLFRNFLNRGQIDIFTLECINNEMYTLEKISFEG